MEQSPGICQILFAIITWPALFVSSVYKDAVDLFQRNLKKSLKTVHMSGVCLITVQSEHCAVPELIPTLGSAFILDIVTFHTVNVHAVTTLVTYALIGTLKVCKGGDRAKTFRALLSSF